MPYGRTSGCYKCTTFLENLNEGTRNFVLMLENYFGEQNGNKRY